MNINFKEESGDIRALRAIKPLAHELMDSNKDLPFAGALNQASKELGFNNYREYKLDYIRGL